MLIPRMELGLRAASRWPLTCPSSQCWPLKPAWHRHRKVSGERAWQVPPLRQDDDTQGDGTQRCWPESSVTVTWGPGHLQRMELWEVRGSWRHCHLNWNCSRSIDKCVVMVCHLLALVFPPQVHAAQRAAARLAAAGVTGAARGDATPLQNWYQVPALSIQRKDLAIEPDISQTACATKRPCDAALFSNLISGKSWLHVFKSSAPQ